MDRNKAIGYALIIIGLFFGIEGTVMTWGSTWLMGEANEAISLYSVFENPMDSLGPVGFYQSLQTIAVAVLAYSFLKTIAGIACIFLGYLALKAKK